MSDHRILLVEDDGDTCTVMRALLRSFGYEVHLAKDGVSAITEAISCQPDLMLLDLGLPGQNGFKVLDTLRSIDGFRDLPVIVLSAQEPFSSRELADEAGASDFLQKPVDRDLLLASIRTHLEPETDTERMRETPVTPAPEPHSAVAGPPNILLMDADTAPLHQLKALLDTQGFQVHVCADAVTGLAYVQQSAPDLLVAGMQVPGADCFEFIERMAGVSAPLRNIPVVVLTNQNHATSLAQISRYQVAGTVIKPFDLHQLRGLIADLVKKAHARMEDPHAAPANSPDRFIGAPSHVRDTTPHLICPASVPGGTCSRGSPPEA